jgi:hypothetical protein
VVAGPRNHLYRTDQSLIETGLFCLRPEAKLDNLRDLADMGSVAISIYSVGVMHDLSSRAQRGEVVGGWRASLIGCARARPAKRPSVSMGIVLSSVVPTLHGGQF